MAVRRKRRVTRKRTRKYGKSPRHGSRAWAAFKKKYVRPGMSKTAYREAVRKHWRPTKCNPAGGTAPTAATPNPRSNPRRRRRVSKRRAGPRGVTPKRNSKGRFVRRKR
jgi:hypothetical protein